MLNDMKKRSTEYEYVKPVTSRVSGKYQVVIPQAIRVRIGLKRGDEVMISAPDEDRVIIQKRPKSIVDMMDGLGKDVWEALGGADAYLERERNSWDD